MKKNYFSCLLAILLAGCSTKVERQLTPISFSELPGWSKDTQLQALPAMQKSCTVILRKSANTAMLTRKNGHGQASDWFKFCRQLQSRGFKSNGEFRRFLEVNLHPYQVSTSGNSEGVFTGYYEPILNGSLRRHGKYQTPLYKLPGKNINYKIPRSQIVRGSFKGKKLELVWIDDPVEAFFLQIQGSGRVKLNNGRELRLGYAGQNGYPYFPIGKTLVDKGYLRPDQVTMQNIKKWLRTHPRQAESIMSTNKSYVFFKIAQTRTGPIGSHGVPLTPQRSMAVDRSFISLGTPLWLSTTHPGHYQSNLQKLMVAQDTGGAIKGAVRGDYFWGSGNNAGNYAGKMNSKGNLFILLPK